MSMTDEYDSPWKEILSGYFSDFMAFFFLDAYNGIDWDRGYDFLDKELRQVTREAKFGQKLADKLVRVWRKDGDEVWVLVHVEVQGQVQQEFAKRMFIYNYRIFDRYDRPVMSCAILTDDRLNWRPESFGYNLWGCELNFRFPVAKILDYAGRWEELEKSTNPFALAVMAHLKARETKGRPEDRSQWKWRLVRNLYGKGYARNEIVNLFRFIDWIMQLPEELEERFWRQVVQYEEEISMQYVTSGERIGIKKGIQQGVIQNAQEMVIEALAVRFEAVPKQMVKKIKGITSHATLKGLLRSAVKAADLAEFKGVLHKVEGPGE